MKKSALGRGLGALISDADSMNFNRPSSSEGEPGAASISEISVDKIVANPYQPRSTFDLEALQELADSIKLLGLIQPITVRLSDGGKYQIISGERRFRASQMAGLKTIPAYIRKADDQGMLEMAIVENIQRENLDSIEIALSFQRLIEECSLTQEEMAERVGKKRATVTNYLRLLKLPAEIQLAIRAGKITMGHAKAILSIENTANQLKVCNMIIEKDLSVRAVEERVKKLGNEKDEKRDSELHDELSEPCFRVIELVGKYFNNNVSLKKGEGGAGSLTIRFNSEKEIEDFRDALEKINQ
ncbi:MAG: ParB/RepB/Spo0J family partition protein [Bacteroidales bacterium]|jgi:ParB family chromosome partitioning protein|nr:ParB/RepB/Spo0J family partition protein [Bacteroidales bacterium]